MPREKKGSYVRVIEDALRRLLNDHPDSDYTIKELSSLVIGGNLIDGFLLDGIREKAVERFISQVLRKAAIKQSDGSRVRAFQSYTKFSQDEGREVQLRIWKDIDCMSRAQMLIAAKERVKHVKESRESLTNDLRYWNNNVRPKVGGGVINLEF